MKPNFRYQSHNKSRSNELRLVQKYVKAYSSHSIITMLSVIPIHVSFYTYLHSDSWGSETNSHNLGRGSKCFRNNGMIDKI
jgi:hypothetical protein